jgi:tetratricopeptide (TPR) repeat protein
MSRAPTTARLPRLVPLLLAMLVLVLSTSRPARAEQPIDDSRATKLYNESLERYREGRFKEAADLLRELYRARPEAVLLYNLGRACEGSGDFDCAIDAYSRYLSEDVDATDRGAIEQRVKTLQQELEEHRALEKHRAPSREREASQGTKPAPSDTQPMPRERTAQSMVPWVVAGVGALALATGLIIGTLAERGHSEAVSDPVQQSAAAKQGKAEELATAANAVLIAGGVIAAAGVGWGVWNLGRSRARTAQTAPAVELRMTLRGVLLSATF